MRLTVLGAGPAYTDRPGATGASYLVSLGDTHVLLDLGQGSLPRLFAAIPPTSLAAVVISHLHPDHFIDLVALRHYLRWEFDPPRRSVCWGPPGWRTGSMRCTPTRVAAQSFDTETLGTGRRVIGELRVRATLVHHTAESYGIRVAPGSGGRASCTAGTAAGRPILHPSSGRHAAQRGVLRARTGREGRPPP